MINFVEQFGIVGTGFESEKPPGKILGFYDVQQNDSQMGQIT
jgi:hypothetical protein